MKNILVILVILLILVAAGYFTLIIVPPNSTMVKKNINGKTVSIKGPAIWYRIPHYEKEEIYPEFLQKIFSGPYPFNVTHFTVRILFMVNFLIANPQKCFPLSFKEIKEKIAIALNKKFSETLDPFSFSLSNLGNIREGCVKIVRIIPSKVFIISYPEIAPQIINTLTTEERKIRYQTELKITNIKLKGESESQEIIRKAKNFTKELQKKIIKKEISYISNAKYPELWLMLLKSEAYSSVTSKTTIYLPLFAPETKRGR